MQYFYQNNNSNDLIVFFSGWGCDYNQFVNLHDQKDVLILYDYQNLNLDFNFSRYSNVYIIGYSAGVFIAAVMDGKIPNVRQKIAVCGNPYLFDETFGLPEKIVQISNDIGPDNYLEFRRKYMVYTDEEYEMYNKLESLRTIESCKNELKSLQRLYAEYKDKMNPKFDKAIVAENDLIFNLKAQREFYKNKLQIIKNSRHHIFFHFNSFADLLNKNTCL